MQALIFGYLFIKKKVRALRWRRTEASPSMGQHKSILDALRFPPARDPIAIG